MLVLARRFGERVVVNDGLVVVEVIRINRDGSIAVGFVAAPDVRINREEVQRRSVLQGINLERREEWY